MKNVPTLDIRRYDTDREAFVAELGAAYREFGFCCISGHGIPRELIDGSYDVFQRFFALPTETKMKYHVAGSGGARGYTPFKVETAKDSQYADLKEFWHIGREIPRDSKFADVMPPNLWPSEVPDFRQYGYGLYEALDQLGTRVLRALALHIDRAGTFLRRQDRRRQLDPASDPLSADHPGQHPERARRRARRHQLHHPAGRRQRRGAGSAQRTANGCRSPPRATRSW